MDAPFISSATFSGAKVGYIFTTGALGTGYYPDGGADARGGDVSKSGSSSKKRARDEDVVDIDALISTTTVAEPLTATSLPGLMGRLKSYISKNEEKRAKFSEEPSKFMDRWAVEPTLLALVLILTLARPYPRPCT